VQTMFEILIKPHSIFSSIDDLIAEMFQIVALFQEKEFYTTQLAPVQLRCGDKNFQ